MERKSFSFYQSFYKAIQCLDNNEDKLKAYDYIVTYGITWQEPEEKDGAAYTLFVLAKPHLDANNKRYEKRLKSMWRNEALSRNGQW